MKRAALLLSASISFALVGCVAGPPPEIATPVPEVPQSFTYAPTGSEAAALADLLPSDDRAFLSLSNAAFANSPSLLEAAARVDRAIAGRGAAAASRMPQITGSGSVEATRTNPNQFGTNLPQGISIDTERVAYGANLSAVWDPDLFGRLRAQERSTAQRAEAAAADVSAVRLSLTAEIAGAVIDWRTLSEREAALNEDLVAAESLVALADIRERAGIAPGFDRVRAETTAEASRSRLAVLANERPRIVGRLITLTAQPASRVREILDINAPETRLSAAPASLPSNLLNNRPDIIAASARLSASDSDLAATAANRFPQFTLSAALGLLTFDLGDLFNDDAVVGSVGGSLLAPLLEFGRIEAQIDGAAADKRIAFQSYRGRVFAALGETEAAYGLVAAADRELAAATREYASANRAAQLAEVRFRAGLANFLTVLDARRAADASGERVAASRGRASRARVLLWQALGGNNVGLPE
ncbi:multidrug efflux RND transporter outer membrane channel subunit AdeK [Pontixanthobacter gangjinensis]|uniref:Efflux transporter outer membrane subunit n=1 Tax=Pontixanthobacter gangjinensis TaxID=1028742 RepID=A0A6I4SLI5_9SPHN|nr:efflux transporter outer membrane subunit [Pontixanthobacter gangjinensis]MXO56016.1 efflux transporter outer membrane subunit [Pontixanthobacter gangjinensis]